ncbi:MAG: NUDIX hydrolase [Gammaproteobacteria bacterium]|nr:NUDIX hydrolase [Gammaproteobacteria bacterium]
MNFCSLCGEKVAQLIPEGDNRLRYVCNSCGEIHYQNPKIVTGCIPEWENNILLCRRAIEPQSGLWTLPAGFMENQESNLEGAAREAQEEANADMRDMKLFSMFSIPHRNQIYTMYRGVLHEGKASAGEETLEVAMVSEEDMPWQEMAFPVVVENLKLYFEDRRKGEFGTHYGEIVRQNDGELIVTMIG